MRHHLRAVLFLLLILVAGACARHTAPASGPASGRGTAVSETSVRTYLEFLASDALNGRGSGTRDEQIAAEYVGAHFRKLGLRPAGPGSGNSGYVQAIPFSRTRGGTTVTGTTYNAVAILQGTDPSSEAILITAHLDHLGRRETAQGDDKIFNGADDDASGTVAVMTIAEALSGRKVPKRTVIFACFGSEEAGGFGAAHLRDHPPVPLEKIVANVEFEMIGRPDPKVPPHTLWFTGFERSDLGPVLASHGARLVQDPHREQNFFRRSDNYTLAVKGVVAHTVSSFNLHKEYHTPADEVSRVDYAHMTEAIGSMVEPLWWLANAGFRPAWKPGMKP